MMTNRKTLCLGVALSALWTTSAWAQDTGAAEPSRTPAAQATEPAARQDDSALIVVTGSRMRAESVQRTPLAVSVLTPQTVYDLHANNITALTATVPNVVINASSAATVTPFITIRGFNTLASDPSVEPGIAVYVDGIYQSNITGSLVDLDDVGRVEVLRGPQGTFVGKNASAGAILVTRSQPTGQFGGYLTAEYGSFDAVRLNALLNFPIIPDRLGAKIFLAHRSRGDLVDNLAVPGGDLGGQNVTTARLAFLITPSSDVKIYLSGDYTRDRTEQPGLRSVSGPTTVSCTRYGYCAPDANGYLVTRSTFLDRPHHDDYNLVGRLEWSTGPVLITALGGYRDYRSVVNLDLDATPAPLLQIFDFVQAVQQLSEEVRFSSQDAGGLDLGGRLRWLIALYNLDADAQAQQGQVALGNPSNRSQKVVRDSRAIFGHFDYEIVPSLTLTGGIRFSWDRTRHNYGLAIAGTAPPPPLLTQAASFRNTSLEAGAQYQINHSNMVYVRYAEGYRGGGFIGFPTSVAQAVAYRPETSRSYEGGIRTGWFDNRVQFNLTAFKTDFQDLQRSAAIPAPNGTFITATANVAAATTKGFEAELLFNVASTFSLRANLGYLHARFTNYTVINATTGQLQDLSSTPFPYAPHWTVSVSPELRLPLGGGALGFDTLTLQSRVGYQSTLYVSSANINPLGLQRGYALTDASIRLSGRSGLSLTVFARNVFDKHYITQHSNASNLIDVVGDGAPRTYGINLGYTF